jgi:beta-xylosidase
MLKVAVGAQNAGGNAAATSPPAIAGLFQNPVFASAPDPYILDVGARHSDYYAFATGNLFPVLRSTDLVHWTAAGRAMTAQPTWVVAHGDWHPWAPSVIAAPASSCPGTTTAKCFVMYYTGLSATYGVNCVAVATATSPGGPYADQGPLAQAGATGQPQGCADAAGRGNIDPSPFVDADGRAYLYTATDFSPTGLRPTVSVTPLADDLTHASGPRVPLFSGDANTWEAAGVSAPTVEGPMMVLHNGTYYLFYSGGSWQNAYGMGYATGPGPTGPFTKSASNPIFAQTPSVLSPGGGDTPVAGVRGGLWLLYHARANSYSDPRTLRIDRLLWQPGSPDAPLLGSPSATPQTTAP